MVAATIPATTVAEMFVRMVAVQLLLETEMPAATFAHTVVVANPRNFF